MKTVDGSPEAVEAGQGNKFNQQDQIWNSNDGACQKSLPEKQIVFQEHSGKQDNEQERKDKESEEP